MRMIARDEPQEEQLHLVSLQELPERLRQDSLALIVQVDD